MSNFFDIKSALEILPEKLKNIAVENMVLEAKSHI